MVGSGVNSHNWKSPRGWSTSHVDPERAVTDRYDYSPKKKALALSGVMNPPLGSNDPRPVGTSCAIRPIVESKIGGQTHCLFPQSKQPSGYDSQIDFSRASPLFEEWT